MLSFTPLCSPYVCSFSSCCPPSLANGSPDKTESISMLGNLWASELTIRPPTVATDVNPWRGSSQQVNNTIFLCKVKKIKFGDAPRSVQLNCPCQYKDVLVSHNDVGVPFT